MQSSKASASAPRDAALHSRGVRALAACAGLALTGLQCAHALQLVDVRDGVAVEAIVSIKEPTRIRIEGAPITDVFGSIHSNHCGATPWLGAAGASPAAGGSASPGVLDPANGSAGAPTGSPAANPAGDVVVACDRDKGEIYIRPVGTSDKPINLFIASATATYTLVLRRSDTPADTIVLRDRTPQSLRPLPAGAAASPVGPAPSHIRAMKALLLAMASDRVPPDVRVEETLRPVRLWAEARVSLLRLYEGRGLVGELYTLQNVSTAPMVLAEQEFDRPSPSAGPAGSPAGEVAGVAIERHTLRPGESTHVYVIRRGGVQ